ncbi:MAG: IS1380 family transposase, partial [Mycobacterium sp.]
CAAIAHNLLHAAGVLTGGPHATTRAATLRRRIVNIPARLARPQRRPVLHLPSHWPWAQAWKTLWRTTISHAPHQHPPPRAVST